MVVNPPYGERLMDVRSAEALYREMGECFSKLDKWQIYVLTSDDYFEKHYGRRADKVRKLYNGMLKCNLYQYFKAPDEGRPTWDGNKKFANKTADREGKGFNGKYGDKNGRNFEKSGNYRGERSEFPKKKFSDK